MPASKKKRELILEAAYYLFLEKGYDDTKIKDIADAAGIGKGTVYEYFSSKEELFAKLLDYMLKNYKDGLSEISTDSPETAAGLLSRFIDYEMTVGKHIGQYRDNFPSLFIEAGLLKSKLLTERLHDLMRCKLTMVQNILKRGIAAGEFDDVDTILASAAFLGALDYCIGIKYQFIAPAVTQKESKEPDEIWKREDIAELILNRMKKK